MQIVKNKYKLGKIWRKDMFIEERQKDIVRRVNENGRILVTEIQENYHVSADCARRDLRQLESKGLLKRTYGGAMAISPIGVYPEKMYNPKELSETKKDYYAVAQKALEYINKNEVIYLTTSSIGYYMAVCFPSNLEVTILTNSVTIADVLRKKDNVSVILLGGEMSHRGHCHDFYTVQMVKNIRIDKAFLSHTGLSVDFGASLHNSSGVEFSKAVMHNSTINIGLYPSEKIGRNSIHSVCSINEYDLIITDNGISEDFKEQMDELDLKLEIVNVWEE